MGKPAGAESGSLPSTIGRPSLGSVAAVEAPELVDGAEVLADGSPVAELVVSAVVLLGCSLLDPEASGVFELLHAVAVTPMATALSRDNATRDSLIGEPFRAVEARRISRWVVSRFSQLM
jgi:hypothetical protein